MLSLGPGWSTVAATTTADSKALLNHGYRECSRITRRFGTTYYWGVLLLGAAQRRHVHAVYALCRLADDIVDAPGATSPGQIAATTVRLAEFSDELYSAVAGEPTSSPVIAAAAETIRECGLPRSAFDRFFAAMTADLTVTRYESWDDLCGYMDGSAAVIGELMLPVLHPISPDAWQPARSLGLAFQLTNFLRDVGEDWRRGRIYLPQEDLRRFGAMDALRRGQVNDNWRAMMSFEITRNRELYATAREGVDLLPRRSAACVGVALQLYSEILDRIEDADYDVFASRVRVPLLRKASLAARNVGR